MRSSSPSNKPTPSVEDMQAAWHAVAGRDWPSLHELAQSAARYELVLGTAARRARGAVQTPAPAPAAQVARPHVPKPAPWPPAPPRQAPAFDQKRAAAGERPDDD